MTKYLLFLYVVIKSLFYDDYTPRDIFFTHMLALSKCSV